MMGGDYFWMFPIFGFVMMVVFIGFMFTMFGRRGGSGSWMGGGWPQSPLSRRGYDEPALRCPSCEESVQRDWKLCPNCGASLA